MNKPAIEVKNISKSYQINHKNKASYSTLKDDFGKLLRHPFRKDATVDKEETFWALDDISFSVNPGEIFGIIGRNGSGKSTLLKILSRIVEPTKGEAILRGKVASLLEVGTGFNPELTGRENIYFNGSMLGMSKREITKKFNEIVWFSEVEKFLDTPVKFYSSGMYVRLAFSVAAHLEPDILILDEVLAVGDAAFQKKSLNKILDTMNDGRTVLFVSHSMGSVQQLCTRGMLIKDGHIETIGSVGEVTERYTALMRQEEILINETSSWEESDSNFTNDYFIPHSIHTLQDNKLTKGEISAEKEIMLRIKGEVKSTNELLTIGVAVYNSNKTLLFLSYPSDNLRSVSTHLPKGDIELLVKIPANYLNSGEYRISLIGGVHNKHWIFEPGAQNPSVTITLSEKFKTSPYWKFAREGLMAPKLKWEVRNER